MAITLNTTGPVAPPTTKSSVYSYSFCSGVITTTANYDDNKLDFGVPVQEIHIVNAGANALCFQFEDHEGTTKDSGIVMGNTETIIRKAYKSKMKIRSADLAAATTAYVFAL